MFICLSEIAEIVNFVVPIVFVGVFKFAVGLGCVHLKNVNKIQ